MKRLTLILLFTALICGPARAQIVTVGDTSCSVTCSSVPVDHYWGYSESQYCIPDTEMAAAFPSDTLFFGIGWYLCDEPVDAAQHNIRVYLNQAPPPCAPVCTIPGYDPGVLVYTGPLGDCTPTGCCTVTLDTPYLYTSGNCLYVTVCDDQAGYSAFSSSRAWAHNSDPGNGIYHYNDTTGPYDCDLRTDDYSEGDNCCDSWATTCFDLTEETPTPTITPTPVPGDACPVAFPISCGNCVTGNTSGFTNQHDCGNGHEGNDVVYALTVTTPGSITVIGDADFDADWTIETACGNSGDILCTDFTGTYQAPSCSTLTHYQYGYVNYTFSAVPGVYYIWVDGYYGSSAGNYALEVLCANATATPTPTPTPTELPPDFILITEVFYDANPPGPEPAMEWIEFTNCGTAAVDISNWEISDDENNYPPASEGHMAFPPGSIVGPGQVIVVANNGTQFNNYWGPQGFPAFTYEMNDSDGDPTNDMISIRGPLGLGNSGDEVTLWLPNGSGIVDMVGWGSGSSYPPYPPDLLARHIDCPGASVRQSLQRCPHCTDTNDCSVDFQCIDLPDPGVMNGCTNATATPTATPTPAPGDNCLSPLLINLPADLPYSDLSQTTCGRIDDYNATCLGNYDGGEDIIYEITVASTTSVVITLDPKGTLWTGMALDDTCPPDGTCIDYATDNTGNPYSMACQTLGTGVYYLMIDIWPSPNCIADFDLTITSCVPPTPTQTPTITPTPTPCTVLYSNTFDDAAAVANWTFCDDATSPGWTNNVIDFYNGGCMGASGDTELHCTVSGYSNSDWAISPPIVLNCDDSTIHLAACLAGVAWGSDPTNLTVFWRCADDGMSDCAELTNPANWTLLMDIPNMNGAYDVDLSFKPDCTCSTIMLAFYDYSDYGYGASIDNLVVCQEPGPACGCDTRITCPSCTPSPTPGTPQPTPTLGPIPTTGPLGIGFLIMALSALLGIGAFRRKN